MAVKYEQWDNNNNTSKIRRVRKNGLGIIPLCSGIFLPGYTHVVIISIYTVIKPCRSHGDNKYIFVLGGSFFSSGTYVLADME